MQLREAREAVKTLYDVRTTKTTYSTLKKVDADENGYLATGTCQT
jgi:hypothetical protein